MHSFALAGPSTNHFSVPIQALQAIHSKRVAICNLTAAKVVKYGKVWKILGLELAHKEGEIFGNRVMVPGAPQSLSGIVWSPDNSCDSPESVAAWATVWICPDVRVDARSLLCAVPLSQAIHNARPHPCGKSDSESAIARKLRMRSRRQLDLICGIWER